MRLIDADAAIDALCSVCNALGGGHNCDKTKFVYNAPFDEQVILCPEHYALTMLPSAQPERKTGKWIERESGTEDKENGFETVIVCSCCDFPATTFYSEDCESRTQIRTDFCPNCGAKMEKR